MSSISYRPLCTSSIFRGSLVAFLPFIPPPPEFSLLPHTFPVCHVFDVQSLNIGLVRCSRTSSQVDVLRQTTTPAILTFILRLPGSILSIHVFLPFRSKQNTFLHHFAARHIRFTRIFPHMPSLNSRDERFYRLEPQRDYPAQFETIEFDIGCHTLRVRTMEEEETTCEGHVQLYH